MNKSSTSSSKASRAQPPRDKSLIEIEEKFARSFAIINNSDDYQQGEGSSTESASVNHVTVPRDVKLLDGTVEQKAAEFQSKLTDIQILTLRVIHQPRDRWTYTCTITRDTGGVGSRIFPTYYLHEQHRTRDGRNKRAFLMTARRNKLSITANYTFFICEKDMQENGDYCVGGVKSNLLATQCTIYGKGEDSLLYGFDPLSKMKELAAVVYNTNRFGLKDPQKMNILASDENVLTPYIKDPNMLVPLPKVDTPEEPTLLEKIREKKTAGAFLLKNMESVLEEPSQTFFLDSNGSATKQSAKNLQIVQEEDPNRIVLRLEQISENEFTLDYGYPLTAIQAFGIALTNLI